MTTGNKRVMWIKSYVFFTINFANLTISYYHIDFSFGHLCSEHLHLLGIISKMSPVDDSVIDALDSPHIKSQKLPIIHTMIISCFILPPSQFLRTCHRRIRSHCRGNVRSGVLHQTFVYGRRFRDHTDTFSVVFSRLTPTVDRGDLGRIRFHSRERNLYQTHRYIQSYTRPHIQQISNLAANLLLPHRGHFAVSG